MNEYHERSEMVAIVIAIIYLMGVIIWHLSLP